MHTYKKNAPKSDAKYPLPVEGVENREEIDGPWVDHNRPGTGDHQSGSATRYHPLLHDIGIHKSNHGFTFMQQYGLETPSGNIFKPGQGCDPKEDDECDPKESGRLYMERNGDKEVLEGSLRPCGMNWITAFASEKGNVCAKVTKEGQITTWNVIDAGPPRTEDDTRKHFGEYKRRFVRLATLGSKEVEAKCGADARFLMGYENKDKKRFLVELDGNCNQKKGPFDVSALTTWPAYEEWTTRADGAVVWVTAWDKDFHGEAEFNHWGTRDVNPTKKHGNLKTYGQTSHFKNGYGALFGGPNEAKITVYWPSGSPTPSPTPPSPTPSCADVIQNCKKKFCEGESGYKRRFAKKGKQCQATCGKCGGGGGGGGGGSGSCVDLPGYTCDPKNCGKAKTQQRCPATCGKCR
jgi:hypothetical protein